MSNTKTEAKRRSNAIGLADQLVSQFEDWTLAHLASDELRRLDALCDERGTNEARMLMRLTEMQKQVDQLQAEAGQFKALAKANADALGASLSERDQLREALQKILNWNSHTTNYAAHLGSNGVRDFYREIARQALATTEPVMANGLTEAETDASASVVGLATTEPEPIMELGETLAPEQLDELWGRYPEVREYLKRKMQEKAGYKHGAWGDKPEPTSKQSLQVEPSVNQQLTTEPVDEREAFTDEAKDAARYRWLRDNTGSDWAICEWSDDPGDEGYYREPRAPHIVDAAIDAAMAQGVKG